MNNTINRLRYPKSLWSDNPLPTGCVFYYPSRNLNGPAFKSIDPFGHELTTTGTTLVPQGRNFQGAGNVDITAVLPSVSTTKGTISVWLRTPDATPVSAMLPLCFGDANALELFYIRVQTTGLWLSELFIAGVQQWTLDTDAAAISDNTWTLWSITHDGTAPVLYVGGVAPTQAFSDQTDKTKWLAAGTNLDNGFLGKGSYSSNPNQIPFTGDIGEVWAHDYALSADQELYLHSRTRGRYD